MSTIHLVYSSLERVLNTRKRNTIALIHRNHKIKNILSECCSLPDVIDNIIFKYTDSEINISGIIDRVYNFKSQSHISLDLITDDSRIIVNIDKLNSNITINADLYLSSPYIGICYHSNQLLHCIDYLNTFMKTKYDKNNYMDCVPSRHPNNTKYMYFIKKNSIIGMSESYPYLNGILIRNYKKLTYLIVTLKCIINGIQKYFKEHYITEYCEKEY